MITLTDDEQSTALRAVRYALTALRSQVNQPRNATAQGEHEEKITKLERTAVVLERINDNGMWRCLCAGNPWRHPTCSVCPTCGMAVPT